MTEPNLFIVGFQKCASSTLFDMLKNHSKISGTTPKETFFLVDKDFDRYDPSKSVLNQESCWDIFISSNNEIILESSVCNFYQKTALEYIVRNKDAKVIFVLRDPIERFISVYKYLYGKIDGIPPDVSLNEFYKMVKTGKFKRHMLKYAIEHGEYHKYISKWVESLGKDRILIIGMKDIIENTDKTLQKVFNFSNLRFEKPKTVRHKNKSKAFRFPLLHQSLVKIFRGTILSNKYTRTLYIKFFTTSIKPILGPKIRAELKEVYSTEYSYYGHLF